MALTRDWKLTIAERCERDPNFVQAWAEEWSKESARRMATYERGEVTSIDSEEVFAELDRMIAEK